MKPNRSLLVFLILALAIRSVAGVSMGALAKSLIKDDTNFKNALDGFGKPIDVVHVDSETLKDVPGEIFSLRFNSTCNDVVVPVANISMMIAWLAEDIDEFLIVYRYTYLIQAFSCDSLLRTDIKVYREVVSSNTSTASTPPTLLESVTMDINVTTDGVGFDVECTNMYAVQTELGMICNYALVRIALTDYLPSDAALSANVLTCDSTSDINVTHVCVYAGANLVEGSARYPNLAVAGDADNNTHIYWRAGTGNTVQFATALANGSFLDYSEGVDAVTPALTAYGLNNDERMWMEVFRASHDATEDGDEFLSQLVFKTSPKFGSQAVIRLQRNSTGKPHLDAAAVTRNITGLPRQLVPMYKKGLHAMIVFALEYDDPLDVSDTEPPHTIHAHVVCPYGPDSLLCKWHTKSDKTVTMKIPDSVRAKWTGSRASFVAHPTEHGLFYVLLEGDADVAVTLVALRLHHLYDHLKDNSGHGLGMSVVGQRSLPSLLPASGKTHENGLAFHGSRLAVLASHEDHVATTAALLRVPASVPRRADSYATTVTAIFAAISFALSAVLALLAVLLKPGTAFMPVSS